MRFVALVLVVLAGCALGDAESVRPLNEPRACYASFAAALEGWEAFVGPVPAECQRLDEVYTIEVTSGEMPCESPDPGRVIGCTEYELARITIRKGIGETKAVDTSVHEWMHALSGCVGVEGNNAHLNARIWGEDPYDNSITLEPESARAYALAASGIGPCID